MGEQVITQAHLTITDIVDGVNANIWTTSVAPSTPNYTFTISNLTGPSGTPRVGDIILQGVYRYTISSVSSTTVLAGSRQSLQGSTGAAGNKWYTGTVMTGTSTSNTTFSNSGITSAVVGDMYLNTSTNNIYRCTVAGDASTAKWVYAGNIKGASGTSVTDVVTYYYLKTVNGSTPTSSTTGSTTIPNFVNGGTYYTRTITTLSVGNPIDTGWVIDGALTTENQNAYNALITAQATDERTAKFINNNTGIIIAGNNVSGHTFNASDTSSYGYNTIMAPNYLGLRYNDINLSKLTINGLEFYYPTLNNGVPVQGQKGLEIGPSALTLYKFNENSSQSLQAAATLNANGLILSKGGLKFGEYNSSTTNFVYLSSEDYSGSPTIRINGNESNWRQIIGNKFGVKNDGTLYANGVNISGTLKSSLDQYNYYEFLPNGLFNIVCGATDEDDPKSGSSFIVFENIEVADLEGTSMVPTLSIQLSDLFMYLGTIYEQDESTYELNILSVMDILDYQQTLMSTWNGTNIYQYTDATSGITYDLEEYTYNNITKYYYDTGIGGSDSHWQQLDITQHPLNQLPIIAEGGLDGSLEFIKDSLGHRQSLLVTSAVPGDPERGYVTIDPHFIDLKVIDDNNTSLEVQLKYTPQYKLTVDSSIDELKTYYKLITDTDTGETIYKRLINPENFPNPHSAGLYELDEGKGINSFHIINNGDDIFNILDDNNYFLSVETGVQFENMGMFHYKNGFAIGIV